MSSVTATAPKDFPTLKKHRVAIENFMAFVEANKDGVDLEFLNELMNAYIKEEIPNIEKAKKSTRKKTFWDTYRTIRSAELMDEYRANGVKDVTKVGGWTIKALSNEWSTFKDQHNEIFNSLEKNFIADNNNVLKGNIWGYADPIISSYNKGKVSVPSPTPSVDDAITETFAFIPVKEEVDEIQTKKVKKSKKVKKAKKAKKSKNDEDDCDGPPDTYFYGELTKKVKDIDQLVEIMRKGIDKYKSSMKKAFGYTPSDDALRCQLDLWFQHDNERNDYFDHLVENSNIPFEKVCERIIGNESDDESGDESGNESDDESGDESDSSESSGNTNKLLEIVGFSSDEE
jgi:hypothetical protein